MLLHLRHISSAAQYVFSVCYPLAFLCSILSQLRLPLVCTVYILAMHANGEGESGSLITKTGIPDRILKSVRGLPNFPFREVTSWALILRCFMPIPGCDDCMCQATVELMIFKSQTILATELLLGGFEFLLAPNSC